MAAGYKGWSQIYIDHPDLKGVQEPLLIYKILDATFALIQHQPLQLVKAILFSFGDFFLRIFGFAKLNFLFQDAREHLIVNLIVIVLLNACLFFGLFRLWKRRRRNQGSSIFALYVYRYLALRSFCSSYRCRFNASLCSDFSIPCLHHELWHGILVRL